MQALWSLGIEARHGIAQSLTLHCGQARGLGAGHAFERVGESQEPHGGPAVPLTGGTPVQVSRRVVLADLECGHGDTRQHHPTPYAITPAHAA